MPREKHRRREPNQTEEPDPIVIYGQIGKAKDAIRININRSPNACLWDISYGIHNQTEEKNDWTKIFLGETFSSPGPCDFKRIKDSIDGFEADMAHVIANSQADWTPWKAAFISLREQLDARIAN